MIGVGEKFPAFSLQGVNKDNNFEVVEVVETYHPLKYDWSVVYFYPKDFTFICPTEIAGMDALVDEANVIGISGDNEFCKLAWKHFFDEVTLALKKHSCRHPDRTSSIVKIAASDGKNKPHQP